MNYFIILTLINYLILNVITQDLNIVQNSDILISDDLNNEKLFSDDAIIEILTQNSENVSQNDTSSENLPKKCFSSPDSNCGVSKCIERSGDVSKSLNVGHEKITLSNVDVVVDSVEYKNNDVEWINNSTDIFTPFYLLKLVPPFVLHTTDGVSEECKRQSAIYLQNLKALQLWALKMYDSTAKIPSGFLNGNINQFGDMDQCMNVRHDLSLGHTMKGQYCLTSMQLTLSTNATSIQKELFKLVHSHFAFKSKLTDPGHRVPRFSSVNWALCVPSGCSSRDVHLALQHTVDASALNSVVSAKVLVEPNMCQINEEKGFSKGFIISSVIFIIFILFAVLGTLDELYLQLAPEWLAGFSVIKNMKSLLSIAPPHSDSDVETVHGIRCLNAILLLIAHKSMATFYVPFINRSYLSENVGEIWSIIGRTSSIYTDPFLMFSGLLTCYSLMGKYNKGQRLSISNEYYSRLFRIVPTLSALILFCTWVLPELSSGPQWPQVVCKHAELCKTYWWRNLLFIHNYFGFQNMCLNHTHHVGIDTQLFLLGVPLSIWLITNPKKFKRNICVLAFIATAATIGRFYIAYTKRLSTFVSYGSSVEDMFRTADYLYIIPPYRVTVYIMGMLLAVLIRNPPQDKLTKRQLTIGWISCVIVFLATFFLPVPMSRIGYQYHPMPASLYAAFAPVGWTTAFGWIIYTQHLGYNSWVGDIFSWRVFTIWTRVSYAFYLTQFPVFFYYVGTVRSSQHYTLLGEQFNWNELGLIAVSSIVLTILFDLPFQTIRKILLRQSGKPIVYKEKENGEVQSANNKMPLSSIIKELVEKTISTFDGNIGKENCKTE